MPKLPTNMITRDDREGYWYRCKRDGKVRVGGARVTTADIAATNGVIHVINKVLIPR